MWERLDAKKACRIAVKRPGEIEDSPETLREIQDWAIDRLLRFKNVVGPRASAFAKAGDQPSSLAEVPDMP